MSVRGGFCQRADAKQPWQIFNTRFRAHIRTNVRDAKKTSTRMDRRYANMYLSTVLFEVGQGLFWEARMK